jgi:hypothetical protein
VSRLWSRFGLRTLSVALLLVAVVGGLYLGRDGEGQRADDSVTAASGTADEQELTERAASRTVATSRQRAAQREAAEKAIAAAKAAAQRARRVDEAATKKKAESGGASGGGGATIPYAGPIPKSCEEFSGNRKTGCAIMLDRGFPIAEFPCLNKLWSKESGWNHRALNEGSGAYGIPQALPGRKMASAGADWRNNPATQIKWGLSYIKGRYGRPCKAWAHSQNVGWY